jgi:radical SAM protein (TIGR01212 family)
LPLEIQYEQGRARLEKKWGRCPTIAYFQNFTSTYAPLPRLVRLYEQALSFKDVVGLTIGTRPDCLPRDLLEYLAELNGRTHLTVELGLQTTFDETAKRLNRGHSYNEFLEGYTALKERGIKVAVHLINGLPGESREMMLENARRVAALSPDFLKIHSLYYRKGSALGEAYLLQKEAFSVLTLEEYVSLVADQIELLPPKTVLERVTGDAERKSLLAPLWTCDKKRVVNLLDQVLEQRGSFQGKSLGVVQDAQSKG